MKYQESAYYGKPVPDGLTGSDRTQYIMLRAIYQAYKAGVIELEEAENIKHFVAEYPKLSVREKMSLLQYCFTLLCDSAGGGDMVAVADSKEVARVYHRLSGLDPV